MDKKRILFVDDEPKVLDGLRRMLRSMRKEFDMGFVESGSEALTMMDREPFDIIVSDMRMPGMDGAELLNRVKESHPEAMRIMLTGQASSEATLRTVGVVHQFLSKPCDSQLLRSTFSRACTLQDRMTDRELKGVITRIKALPVLPSAYAEIMKTLRSPDASVDAVAQIISRDLGMSAKILHLVNSAFFGFFRHISSPAQAVHLLGLDTIKALVLAVQIFSEFEQTSIKSSYLSALWDHSMSAGAFSKAIAKAELDRKDFIDDAFIAGMMHDIGKLVLAANLPEEYESITSLSQKEGIELHVAEHEILKTSHAEVGAYLLELWGLPCPIVEAVAFHHEPASYPGEYFDAVTAVHVANVLDHELNPSEVAGADPVVDLDYISKLGLTERLPEWQATCKETLTTKKDDD